MQRYGTVPEFDGILEGSRVVWEREGELVYMEPYGSNGIRFRSSASLHINTDLNWTLLEPEANPEAEAAVLKDRAVVVNGKIKATLMGDGTVIYENAGGKILLEEEWLDKRKGTAPQREARMYEHISTSAYKVDIFFTADKEEHFYGLGQEANDCMDLKGATVSCFRRIQNVPSPMYSPAKDTVSSGTIPPSDRWIWP